METLHNELLTVEVSDLGAELQSIKDDEGKEYLWQGDGTSTTCQCLIFRQMSSPSTFTTVASLPLRFSVYAVITDDKISKDMDKLMQRRETKETDQNKNKEDRK